jgi:hypothetical protein
VTDSGSLLAAAELAFAALPIDVAEIFVRQHCTPSAMRLRRLDERDAACREFAAERMARAASGAELARIVSTELTRYAASAWRIERGREPALAHRLAHRILTLGRGRAPEPRHMRRILAGQNQARKRPADRGNVAIDFAEESDGNSGEFETGGPAAER